MLKNAHQILLDNIKSSDRVAIGLSGGMDSMCLARLTIESGVLPRENICAIHINHGIRGEHGDSDCRFVEEFCKKEGIEFICVHVDVPSLSNQSGKSYETAGREERRRHFRRLIDQRLVDKVLLAHHKDDQAETILMHIFRGSGLGGLIGMRIQSEGIVRPLLTTSKEQIRQYIIANNIAFVEDATNLDSEYNRNFVRNELLPKIKERWSGVESSLINLSDAAGQADSVLQNHVKSELIDVSELGDGAIKLDCDCFLPHQPTSHYIFEALKRLGVFADIEYKHISAIKELANARNGASIDVSKELRASKEYDQITLYRPLPSPKAQIPFGLGSFVFGTKKLTIQACEPTICDGELVFDMDKVPKGAVIRSRKDGDIFRPFGGGTKKLKQYLIDKKVAQRLRDGLACLCHQNEVLLIFGLAISDKIKLDNDTKKAAKACQHTKSVFLQISNL